MNILMVTYCFYPDGIGGAHSYVYNLAKELIKRGYNIYIITLKMKKDAPNEEIIEGIKVFRYNTAVSGRLIYIRRFLLSIINARRLFKKLEKKVKFDIINYHSVLPACGINILFKKKDIPRVYTFHSSVYKDILVQSKKKRYSFSLMNKLIFLVLRSVEKMTLKAAGKIIVLSDFSKQYIINTYHQDPERIIIIPGGVNSNEFMPARDKIALRKKLHLPENKLILLTARRLVGRMGLENLILAVKRISEEINNIILIILGEGFLKERLKYLIHKENLEEKVKLLGFIDFKEISNYYQASDIFILPSEYDEWFGLVTLEALASGLPVAATPVGGTVEILSPFNKNLLFKDTSSDSIAEGVINLIKSPSELESLHRSCRDYAVKNFSWTNIASRLDSLYKRVAKI